jgi:hypothetical protein
MPRGIACTYAHLRAPGSRRGFLRTRPFNPHGSAAIAHSPIRTRSRNDARRCVSRPAHFPVPGKLVAGLHQQFWSREVMTMKATLFMAAAAAGLLATSGFAQAQDMQATPNQSGAVQQDAQGAPSDSNASGYGGTMSTTKASGASRDIWSGNTSSTCTPGLSCNIYQGQ